MDRQCSCGAPENVAATTLLARRERRARRGPSGEAAVEDRHTSWPMKRSIHQRRAAYMPLSASYATTCTPGPMPSAPNRASICAGVGSG